MKAYRSVGYYVVIALALVAKTHIRMVENLVVELIGHYVAPPKQVSEQPKDAKSIFKLIIPSVRHIIIRLIIDKSVIGTYLK